MRRLKDKEESLQVTLDYFSLRVELFIESNILLLERFVPFSMLSFLHTGPGVGLQKSKTVDKYYKQK